MIAFLCLGQAGAPTSHATIPLIGRKDGYYLEVALPNAKKATFLVDSGSYRSFATKRGLALLKGAGGKALPDGSVVLARLPLGGLSARDVAFAPDDPTGGDALDESVDGLIGNDVLRYFRVGIDLSERRLDLWPGDAPVERIVREWFRDGSPGGVSVKVDSTGLSLGTDESYYVTARFDRADVSMCIDTGTVYTQLSEKLWKDQPRAVSVGTASILGGAPRPVYRFDFLRIGSTYFPGSVRVVGGQVDDDNLLGDDVIEGFRWLLDYRGGKAYFTPKPEPPKDSPTTKV